MACLTILISTNLPWQSWEFKPQHYSGVAENIAQHLTAGQQKLEKMVKSKWQKCTLLLSFTYAPSLYYFYSLNQFTTQYRLPTALRLSLDNERERDRWGGRYKCLECVYGEKGQ